MSGLKKNLPKSQKKRKRPNWPFSLLYLRRSVHKMDTINITGPFVRKVVAKLLIKYLKKKLNFDGELAIHELSVYQDESNDKNLVLYTTIGASVNKNQILDILSKNGII